MKVINVLLIGHGNIGRKFAYEIRKNKQLNLKNIITSSSKNLIKFKNIDLIVICSPIDTHYNYLLRAMRSDKDIIIEKPIVKNLRELKKLIKVNKSYGRKILIHHNDVINLETKKSFINKKNSNIIKMIYGKKGKKQKETLPHLDWLPHPLSVIIYFCGKPYKFKILEYKRNISNSFLKEDLKIEFNCKNNLVYLNFSNDINKPTKKIFLLKKNKMKKIYDGYDKINQRSIKHLLNKYIKSKRINDINSNIETYKLLFKISSKLKNMEKT